LSARGCPARVHAKAEGKVAIPDKAADAVNRGLELFSGGDYESALRMFRAAMDKRPTADEARAAEYNAACACTKLQRWEEAARAVEAAVERYDLKLSVAIRDKDLAALRERREWAEMLTRLKGAPDKKQLVQMRAEARAPFRFPRLVFFGGLLIGASAGLLIILSRLAAAVKGGEGAPDLNETLTNLAVNTGAVALFSALVRNDLRTKAQAESKVAREEDLGKLEVVVNGRTVLLESLRLVSRPVIVFGSQGQVSRALRAAEAFKEELLLRGVCVVPVIVDVGGRDALEESDRMLAALKGEFSTGKKEGEASKGFEKQEAKGGKKKSDRWRVEPGDAGEWLRWLRDQPESEKVGGAEGQLLWLQIQLDGSVRKSGRGIPTWDKFVEDLPEKDSMRTRLTDGSGI